MAIRQTLLSELCITDCVHMSLLYYRESARGQRSRGEGLSHEEASNKGWGLLSRNIFTPLAATAMTWTNTISTAPNPTKYRQWRFEALAT
jgi:hypothetical protein